MRKVLTIVLIVLSVFLLFGCGGKPKAEKICKVAGLGDTLETWVQDHGKPTKDEGMYKTFKPDFDFFVTFENNRASNILFQDTTKGKAPEDVKLMIPEDAQFTSTKETPDKNTNGMIKLIIKNGHSEKLKKTLPKTNGDFTLTTQIDAQTSKYIGTILKF